MNQKTKRIYNYIVKHKIANDGNSPTSREIIKGANISSTSMVDSHLKKLERAGKIELRQKPGKRTRIICVTGGRWSTKDCYHITEKTPPIDTDLLVFWCNDWIPASRDKKGYWWDEVGRKENAPLNNIEFWRYPFASPFLSRKGKNETP